MLHRSMPRRYSYHRQRDHSDEGTSGGPQIRSTLAAAGQALSSVPLGELAPAAGRAERQVDEGFCASAASPTSTAAATRDASKPAAAVQSPAGCEKAQPPPRPAAVPSGTWPGNQVPGT